MHAFFLICPSCPFQNLSIWPKTPPPPILHVFTPLNDVRAYIAWSWKTTLITWIILRGWYPTSNTSAPGHFNDFTALTAHNWQKWKSTFLTCPCHKIGRVEALGLKYTFKITIFVKMWNLGQFWENLIFCQWLLH